MYQTCNDRIQVRLPAGDKQLLTKIAQSQRVSTSELIRQIIQSYLADKR